MAPPGEDVQETSGQHDGFQEPGAAAARSGIDRNRTLATSCMLLAPTRPVLRPGVNCSLVAPASRLAWLVDGKAYFEAVAAAMERARERIMIVGWHLDSRARLRPHRSDEDIAGLVHRLVETKPGLVIQALIWRNSIWYVDERDPTMLLGAPWTAHPRIEVVLDASHPVGASHHEKIVAVDDRLAFVGGMDLAQLRWDDREHRMPQPLRTGDGGAAYPAVHDVQAMVEGDAARALAAAARERWRRATGNAAPPAGAHPSPWPAGFAPDLADCRVAIAHTRPPHDGRRPAREIARLCTDMIRAARRTIYIESQYFALSRLAALLVGMLRRRRGPEVVIVTCCRAPGLIEHHVMAQNRDFLFARLRRADRHGRLRLVYPARNDDPEREIKIHSKVMVVDDRLLRIGSANLNRRSMGLDSETDIALEAEDGRTRRAIAGFRNDLVAEHLGVARAAVEEGLARTGSLVRTIDALNGGERGLLPFPVDDGAADAGLTPLSHLFDPREPLGLAAVWKALFGQA